VKWWVNVLPEVVSGIEGMGFTDPPADKILESVEQYLSNFGESFFADRWEKCPDDFFVFRHVFIESNRWRALEFVVKDTAASVGVLEVVWVDHYPADRV
jgi:hypothetical protein